jgi:nucleoside-diphosphate-sugar epimerase
MRVLIIGGIQFMGRAIVRKLAGQGHEVTVLHRRPTHGLGDDILNLQADRGDIETVTALLRRERFDVVFDVAYDFATGTTAEQVLAAARAAAPGLRRYVFMSSGAAYGPGTDWRESDDVAPDDFPEPYMRNKASTERALFRLHA